MDEVEQIKLQARDMLLKVSHKKAHGVIPQVVGQRQLTKFG